MPLDTDRKQVGWPRAKHSTWPLSLILALGVSCSCDPFPLPAIGTAGEIGIVGAHDAADPRLGLLRDLLEAEVSMIQGEPAFHLETMTRRAKRNWRTHILLCDLRDSEDAGLVTALATREGIEHLAAQPALHRIYRDVWASGQVVLLLHAHDPTSLRRYLDGQGERIFQQLSDQLIGALRDGLYAGGEQETIGEAIESAHRFRIRVPHGYDFEERPEGVVLKRIVPEEPKRWLLVHYGSADRAPGSPEEWMSLRDSLLFAGRSGDHVDREHTEARPHSFNGRPCIFLDGIWQNEAHMIGGPFRSYGFIERERYYLIDLTVYHPPAPKLPSMRQLMAIASTFGG